MTNHAILCRFLFKPLALLCDKWYIRDMRMIEDKENEMEKTKTVDCFAHPIQGTSNETVAIFADGSRAHVCPQYNAILPCGDHADDCDQLTTMGGRCTCGLLDDIDVPALLADAIARGKFGQAPVPRVEKTSYSNEPKRGDGWCDKCQSYCYGDCEATGS